MGSCRCFYSSSPGKDPNSSGILLFFVNRAANARILLTPKFFRYNTCTPPRMCCKQRTCTVLKFFRCNTYKKQGVECLPDLETRSLQPCWSQTQFSCKKAMLTGDGTSTTCPLGVRPPVAESILKTTTLFENWFSASRYLPLGSMAKWRGSLPPVGIPPAGARVRFPGSMERIAMLSFPRFET